MEPLATDEHQRSRTVPDGNGHAAGSGKHAVILAGGRGTRLGPYTTVLPKPLLPLGDGPILDVVLRQLSSHGFSEITLAVGYLAHLIEAVFRDGSELGVSLRYQREAQPLGTVGPLATMEHLDETFLVMNGDILTTLDYNSLYEAHVASDNLLTIATHVRTVKSDYGVLDLDGDAGPTRRVTDFREKPEIDHTVSMGVYVLNRRVCEYVPCDTPFDLPQLVWRLLELGERVGAYRYDGFWLDIGRHEDYAAAIEQFEDLKPALLGHTALAVDLPGPNGNGSVSRNGHASGTAAPASA
jgi:NDP-mannose synthase